MKKIYFLVAGLLMTAIVFAQAPQKMSYQAVLRDNASALIKSAPVGMKISVLQGSTTGVIVYSETQNEDTDSNGLVSLQVGAGIPVAGTFSAIDWASGPYFLKTETDPTGGSNYTIIGTNELMSVPYALFSANGTPGEPGLQGESGNDGVDGAKGDRGEAGTNGTAGAQGEAGKNGTDGAQGAVGTNGTAGAVGAQGESGTNGANGAQGEAGPAGADGTKGDTGTAGTNGQGGIIIAGDGVVVTGSGTVADPFVASTRTYTKGLVPELGGYVFWLTADGKHGLVAATQDQGQATWYGAEYLTQSGNHSGNGANFRDWRLPTASELGEMYAWRGEIGGFAGPYYWSSTEVDANNAYMIFWGSANSGRVLEITKDGTYYVRAVRAF
jgi:hypothetical protein